MPNAQMEIDAILAEAQTVLDARTAHESDLTGASSDSSRKFTPAKGPTKKGNAAHGRNLRHVLQLEVPVIVRLAERKMPVKAILQLATGSIIEFDKPADDELDLMINNKCIGHGQAVKAGENFGLRVTTICSVRDKIEALGGR